MKEIYEHGFPSRSRIFHLYGQTIWLQNIGNFKPKLERTSAFSYGKEASPLLPLYPKKTPLIYCVYLSSPSILGSQYSSILK
jgi:hypothetical protein